jgi:hypothetical protein
VVRSRDRGPLTDSEAARGVSAGTWPVNPEQDSGSRPPFGLMVEDLAALRSGQPTADSAAQLAAVAAF